MRPDQAQRISQLQDQQAALTRALVAMDQGVWTGAGSVEAWLYALNPLLQGQLQPLIPAYTMPEPPPPAPPAAPKYRYSGSNNSSGPMRTGSNLVVVHGSRSGRYGNRLECIGTINYVQNPASNASYNWIIDYDGTIYELTGWDRSAWHAGYLNQRAWSVCLAQPTTEDEITQPQHGSLKWMLTEISHRRGVPYRRAENENAPGFIEHKDTAQGRTYGKSDVGYRLDWTKLGL